MTNQETTVFAGAMATVWPTFEVNHERVKILALLLRDVSVGDAMTALEVLANTHDGEFAPSIPTLMKTIRKASEPPADRLGAEEALRLVGEAVRKFGRYREGAALKSLPLKAATAVRSIGWEAICNTTDDNQAAMRAHFYRTFDAVKKREADDRFLPNGREKIAHSELLRLVDGATRTVPQDTGIPGFDVTSRTTRKRAAL